MVVDYVAGTGNYSYTFSGNSLRPPQRVEFSNDGAADAVLTINGLAITVKGGETLSESFSAFTTAAISGTPGAWRLLLAR